MQYSAVLGDVRYYIRLLQGTGSVGFLKVAINLSSEEKLGKGSPEQGDLRAQSSYS